MFETKFGFNLKFLEVNVGESTIAAIWGVGEVGVPGLKTVVGVVGVVGVAGVCPTFKGSTTEPSRLNANNGKFSLGFSEILGLTANDSNMGAVKSGRVTTIEFVDLSKSMGRVTVVPLGRRAIGELYITLESPIVISKYPLSLLKFTFKFKLGALEVAWYNDN